MRRGLKLLPLLLAAAVLSTSCGKLFRSGVQTYTDEPFPKLLSAWGLLEKGAPLKAAKGVIAYELNTPLFSDYALKYRYLWLPEGQAARYSENDVFDFPVGTVIAKTFAFPDDTGHEKLIETRVLVHAKAGWKALPYVWNAEQTDATLQVAADPIQVKYTNPEGRHFDFQYQIPNVNECMHCHEKDKNTVPIGLKARNINRDHDYPDGRANQLAYLVKAGFLTGAPAPDKAPRVPVWNDPNTGTLESRARAYLDNNCAHCHQSGGVAGYTAFLLGYNETDPKSLGFCKLPNSAGYTGNRPFDVVPGDPSASILLYRMQSLRPKEMMPEIGRGVTHDEGIALVRDWLASLKGGCSK